MPKDGTKQKAEMTVEDFILLYRGDLYFTDQYEFMLSDLRSVIRGKLYEFAQEFNESSSPYILDGMIEKFLNTNQ